MLVTLPVPIFSSSLKATDDGECPARATLSFSPMSQHLLAPGRRTQRTPPCSALECRDLGQCSQALQNQALACSAGWWCNFHCRHFANGIGAVVQLWPASTDADIPRVTLEHGPISLNDNRHRLLRSSERANAGPCATLPSFAAAASGASEDEPSCSAQPAWCAKLSSLCRCSIRSLFTGDRAQGGRHLIGTIWQERRMIGMVSRMQ